MCDAMSQPKESISSDWFLFDFQFELMIEINRVFSSEFYLFEPYYLTGLGLSARAALLRAQMHLVTLRRTLSRK